MPNYAVNRLTLTGPTEELERFQRECIRVRRDDDTGEPALDFEALVPMPAEIVATFDGGPQSREAARAATGYDGWYDWSVARWGTKWNASTYEGRKIGDTIYDCVFDTAWSCPQPAVAALAARYPLLSGTIVSNDPSMDWCVIGDFRDGKYTSATGEDDPQVNLLIRAGCFHGRFRVHSALALVESLTEPNAGSERPTDPRLRSVLTALHRLVPSDVSRRLGFERTVLDTMHWLNAGETACDILEQARFLGHETSTNIERILKNDRARTELDRRLLTELAACLRSDILFGYDEEEVRAEFRHWIEDCLLSELDEDDLCAWATVAMFRPDVLIDMGDTATLERSFLAYADQLRADLLAYLSVDVPGDHGVVETIGYDVDRACTSPTN